MSDKRVVNRGGRPSKWDAWLTEEGLLRVQGWARDGLSEEQIAHNMGIVRATFAEWKKKFPSLLDAIKKGKEVVDREVENAMLKRALGYEYDEVTQEPVTDKDTGITEMRVTKVVTKQIVPDVTAQIFWLKNRKPEEFRDKRDVELSGSVDLGAIIERARGRADE